MNDVFEAKDLFRRLGDPIIDTPYRPDGAFKATDIFRYKLGVPIADSPFEGPPGSFDAADLWRYI